jgi:hypothetical protein
LQSIFRATGQSVFRANPFFRSIPFFRAKPSSGQSVFRAKRLQGKASSGQNYLQGKLSSGQTVFRVNFCGFWLVLKEESLFLRLPSESTLGVL